MQGCEKGARINGSVSNRNKFDVSVRKSDSMIEAAAYVDNFLRICLVGLGADVIYRLYLCLIEYIYYINRYLPPNRMSKIFSRCFSFSSYWKICWCLTILGMLVRSKTVHHSVVDPCDFLYMPIYWIFKSLQFPHSNLDYAIWIRTPSGLDYGEGMASSYFHGYLKLIMPQQSSPDRGIRERIQLYCNQHGVEFITNRLVILIPDIMYVSPKIESRLLEKAEPLEPVIRDRAGVNRPYKNDVYRFNERLNGRYYYIAMEGATPLQTFFEGRNATEQTKEFQREILFKFSQSIKRIVQSYPGTRNEIEIILYNATMGNGEPQDVGEVIKAHFQHIWNKENDDTIENVTEHSLD